MEAQRALWTSSNFDSWIIPFSNTLKLILSEVFLLTLLWDVMLSTSYSLFPLEEMSCPYYLWHVSRVNEASPRSDGRADMPRRVDVLSSAPLSLMQTPVPFPLCSHEDSAFSVMLSHLCHPRVKTPSQGWPDLFTSLRQANTSTRGYFDSVTSSQVGTHYW
jgi:hypothetical protein